MKISFDKSSSIVDREDKLVEKIFEIMIKEMKENDLIELSKTLNLENHKSAYIINEVKKLIKEGVISSYKINEIVTNRITKLFRDGLNFTTTPILKELPLLGVALIPSFGIINNITKPAMRVTIPACIIVAYLRKTILLGTKNEKEEKMEEDFI